MSSTVEQIKSRLGIHDVVSSYIKLEKAGGNFKARCPFHNERTPSFYVSPQRENFHCFGCGKGGDIFSFVQEIEGIEFIDALKILAERAGVEIRDENPGLRSERDRLISILEDATTFYERSLARTPSALEYLTGRGLSKQTIDNFRIGFAPHAWRELGDYLKMRKYADADVEKAGLSVKSQQASKYGNSGYDRFRSRIIFPLRNSSGVIVGFSGRVFEIPGHTYGTAAEQGKYINTPQTQLYDKSTILYGYDRAKNEIRRQDACVLVEGQMDLLMSHQAGVENTVAVSGTALTEHHLGLVKRLTTNLIMAFDPDEAGINASTRGVDNALALGMNVKIANISGDLDPADIIRKDAKEWGKIVGSSKHVISFYIDHLSGTVSDERSLKMEMRKRVLPYVAKLQSTIEQAHFVGNIAHALGIQEEPVWQDLKLLAMASNIGEMRSEDKKYLFDSRKKKIEERLTGLLELKRYVPKIAAVIPEYESRINNILGANDRETLPQRSEKDLARIILEADLAYGGLENDKIIGEADGLLHGLREEVVKERLTAIMAELRRAESGGRHAEAAKFLGEFKTLSEELNRLKN